MTLVPFIAVVDDDESSRRGVARLVRSMNFLVQDFPSASAFLKSRHFCRTACLISDIWMPDMTGIQLHCFLRANGYDIPTILMTGYPDEPARVLAMQRGVICYLSKPFEDDELMHCIVLALRNHASH